MDVDAASEEVGVPRVGVRRTRDERDADATPAASVAAGSVSMDGDGAEAMAEGDRPVPTGKRRGVEVASVRGRTRDRDEDEDGDAEEDEDERCTLPPSLAALDARLAGIAERRPGYLNELLSRSRLPAAMSRFVPVEGAFVAPSTPEEATTVLTRALLRARLGAGLMTTARLVRAKEWERAAGPTDTGARAPRTDPALPLPEGLTGPALVEHVRGFEDADRDAARASWLVTGDFDVTLYNLSAEAIATRRRVLAFDPNGHRVAFLVGEPARLTVWSWFTGIAEPLHDLLLPRSQLAEPDRAAIMRTQTRSGATDVLETVAAAADAGTSLPAEVHETAARARAALAELGAPTIEEQHASLWLASSPVDLDSATTVGSFHDGGSLLAVWTVGGRLTLLDFRTPTLRARALLCVDPPFAEAPVAATFKRLPMGGDDGGVAIVGLAVVRGGLWWFEAPFASSGQWVRVQTGATFWRCATALEFHPSPGDGRQVKFVYGGSHGLLGVGYITITEVVNSVDGARAHTLKAVTLSMPIPGSSGAPAWIEDAGAINIAEASVEARIATEIAATKVAPAAAAAALKPEPPAGDVDMGVMPLPEDITPSVPARPEEYALIEEDAPPPRGPAFTWVRDSDAAVPASPEAAALDAARADERRAAAVIAEASLDADAAALEVAFARMCVQLPHRAEQLVNVSTLRVLPPRHERGTLLTRIIMTTDTNIFVFGWLAAAPGLPEFDEATGTFPGLVLLAVEVLPDAQYLGHCDGAVVSATGGLTSHLRVDPGIHALHRGSTLRAYQLAYHSLGTEPLAGGDVSAATEVPLPFSPVGGGTLLTAGGGANADRVIVSGTQCRILVLSRRRDPTPPDEMSRLEALLSCASDGVYEERAAAHDGTRSAARRARARVGPITRVNSATPADAAMRVARLARRLRTPHIMTWSLLEARAVGSWESAVLRGPPGRELKPEA